MTRKRLLMIFTGIVLGGFMIFSLNGKQEKEKERLIKEQDNIVYYLTNKYDDITEIYFDEYKENKETGYKYMYVYINGDILIDVTFSDFGKFDYSIGIYQNGYKLKKKESSEELSVSDNILIHYLGKSE